jgi:hypothetical protein
VVSHIDVALKKVLNISFLEAIVHMECIVHMLSFHQCSVMVEKISTLFFVCGYTDFS